jgi:hypothetical protein
VLAGYDLYKGNPSTTSGWIDPGFRNQIFDARYGGQRTVDGKYELPDGVTALQCTGDCSLQADVSSISGASSYSKLLSSKVGVDVSFGGESFGAEFGASFGYRRIENGTSAGGTVYTQAEAHCCAYKAQVDIFSPPPLTEDFVKAVELAPTEYDADSYLNIIQSYGTHFVMSADMGGVYGQLTEFRTESYADMVSSSFDWSMYARASFIVTINVNAGSDHEKNLSNTFQKYSISQRNYSLGGKPPASGKLEDWVSATLDDPAPIHTELKPISLLFSKQFFTGVNMSALDAKKANVERALEEYCPHYLLPQGMISSCKAPSKDPELQTRRTCLGKTDVLGGPGGVPFDDGVDSITQNGLLSELEVSKVEHIPSTLPAYVQSLQLALRQGDRSWFLQQHGAFGGDAVTWEVDHGTTITAVQVTWCDYVDSLTFYTSEGDEKELGGSGGCHRKMVNFQVEADKQFNITTSRAWLVGLLGRSEKWIDSVGFYFAYLAPPGEGCHGGIEVPRPS